MMMMMNMCVCVFVCIVTWILCMLVEVRRPFGSGLDLEPNSRRQVCRVRSLSLLLSHLACPETDSVTEPRAHNLARATGQWTPGILLSLFSQHWGSRQTVFLFFSLGGVIWTQILMFSWQNLSWPHPVLSPILLFRYLVLDSRMNHLLWSGSSVYWVSSSAQ